MEIGFTMLGDDWDWGCELNCIVGPDKRSSAAAAAAAAAAATALPLLFALTFVLAAAAALRELSDWCNRLPALDGAPTPLLILLVSFVLKSLPHTSQRWQAFKGSGNSKRLGPLNSEERADDKMPAAEVEFEDRPVGEGDRDERRCCNR
uniref:Uncharacterized protein n=1 Tax=Glossina pallidipes TaxID=7398 RepID=A0A1A9ZHZ5_GLOPL